MSLREEFENAIKAKSKGVSCLFETSNKEYIKWLENKINKILMRF